MPVADDPGRVEQAGGSNAPVAQGQTDEHKWATANQANHAYLQFDVVEGAPPPMRAEPPQFPAAFRETRLGAIEGMKAIMGIYDASLGARSNETSGVAIEARAAQGDLATYHYIDNMVRAIRYAGTVVIELMPKIYDAPRVERIIAPDGQAAMVAVNQVFIDPRSMQQLEFRLDSGRYDVVVRAGPSYQTQRQEASQKIAELVKAFPPIAQVAGDLLFKNLDFPEADKIISTRAWWDFPVLIRLSLNPCSLSRFPRPSRPTTEA